MKARIASAGTGKTTSLVLRYLELLKTYPPHRIAVVTYTRMATAEIRERIRAALETIGRGERYLDFDPPNGNYASLAQRYAQQIPEAPIRTIHGFFDDLLRLAAPYLSLDPEHSVVEPGEAMALFHEGARSVAYVEDLADPPLEHAQELFAKQSLAPSLEPTGDKSKELYDFFQKALSEYLRRSAGRRLSPTDIEILALRLAKLPQEILIRLGARVPVVLVDEFQDTNPLQSSVFMLLEKLGVEIEIVGDPKQSIYGFRNADPDGFRRAAENGTLLPPLTTSRRHSASANRLLNAFTNALSKQKDPPFLPQEAPTVNTTRANTPGSTSLFVARGRNYERAAELRSSEANFLASQLKRLVEKEGYRWSDVFVLTRAHSASRLLAATFSRWNIPHVLIGSRGLYELFEIRDLYNALAAALAPHERLDSLAAFLTGPFAALEPATISRILESEDPLAALKTIEPTIHERLELIRHWTTTLEPRESLVKITREPIIEGRSYFSLLDNEQREHVDYVLSKLSKAHSYQRALYLLETLRAYNTDEGSFPNSSGDAVEIMTVHAAKGREAPVVAVFNAGAPHNHRSQLVYVEPFTGRFAIKGDPDYESLKEAQKHRERLEEDRLLYVALSRARDHLIVTASLNWPEGKAPYRWKNTWAHTLMERIGEPERAFDVFEVLDPAKTPLPASLRHTATTKPAEAVPELLAPLPTPPWPVLSPSALKKEKHFEPAHDEAVPNDPGNNLFARIAGILTHEGIARSWHPDEHDLEAILRGEELMNELAPDERDHMVAVVEQHLRSYWSLVEQGLVAAPDVRYEDYAEYPLVFPVAGTTWEGIIDRVYRVGNDWKLEDYKTDSEFHPERYLTQLALYFEALRKSWGIEPEVRLVYLNPARVYVLSQDEIEKGLREIAEPSLSA